MADHEVVVSFGTMSVAEANQHVESLLRDVKESVPGVNATRQRERADTQDFGTTLVLVLGTPAAVALAKALHSWAKRHGTSISLSTKTGEILIQNVDGADAAKIVAAIERTKK